MRAWFRYIWDERPWWGRLLFVCISLALFFLGLLSLCPLMLKMYTETQSSPPSTAYLLCSDLFLMAAGLFGLFITGRHFSPESSRTVSAREGLSPGEIYEAMEEERRREYSEMRERDEELYRMRRVEEDQEREQQERERREQQELHDRELRERYEQELLQRQLYEEEQRRIYEEEQRRWHG